MYSARLAFPVFFGSALVAATTDPALWTTATLDGKTFVNQGLVGFGYIPASARDSYGETLGGLGSAIALEKGTFKTGPNGTFAGRLIAQPDRGYNVETTIDWQARHHSFDFVFSPYYGKSKLDFDTAAKTFSIQYKNTLLYSKAPGFLTSGLDAISSIPSTTTYPVLPAPDLTKLSVDAEGLVLNADGSFWASDEYGPYIYRFGVNGTLLQAIQPPIAVLPTIDGRLNFTSDRSPDFGRDANQGFEGLTASSDGRTLFALLQSATIQDGGGDKDTNRYTRLFSWDISTAGSSRLIGEWVVPLPQSKKGKTYAQSEIYALTSTQFLVLSRDGHGHGDDDNDAKSDYKQADLFDISNATDIHGTKFDGTTPIAPEGKLDKTVVPATYVPFVNYLNSTQLARFGLHNDEPTDRTLIDAKWESFALAPVLDTTSPDDYFLITMADNDFITINGTALGKPYSASYGQDVDTQILVWRVTLPSVPRGSVLVSLSI
ncbi:phytase esterase-like protein [Rhizoctonia solani AG-3 Rhs1AP]|uniref:Phytase esterase-like protein n=1 Tax=Rhizoctonia solani AG-3 Rhs1AP TaxID=1086054 RepID=X8JIC2_9AGAM|nr:phytase esterase-like protein [Rhizoctonia solani AG-3 Rhs1AP]